MPIYELILDLMMPSPEGELPILNGLAIEVEAASYEWSDGGHITFFAEDKLPILRLEHQDDESFIAYEDGLERFRIEPGRFAGISKPG